MEIPQQLNQKGIRFVLLEKKGKKPFQLGWQNKNISYFDPTLISHLIQGGNYGVMGGGEQNLIILDFDNEQVEKEVIEKLPMTFTVRTGSGRRHLYFFSDKAESFKIFDKDMNTLVDVQGEGKQVVGAGSIHPNGNLYWVELSKQIAYVNYSELKAILMPYDQKPRKEKKETNVVPNLGNEEISFAEVVKTKVKLLEVLQALGVDTSKNPTNCPFHDSKGGKCFGFNEDTWHCFHCEESGNIFTIVMKNYNLDYKSALLWFADKFNLKDKYDECKKNFTEKVKKEFIGQLGEGFVVSNPTTPQETQKSFEEIREDLRVCYNAIIELFEEYMDISNESKHLIALWIIGTYFHKHFSTYPILFINAMKGSGKSRLLSLVSWLQYKGDGDLLNNASEAVVFRTAQERGLVFDEFESIGSKERQTMREILNATYKKGGKIKRMRKTHTPQGEQQVVEEFNIFTPVCIANIWGLDEVLQDRSITIILEKSDDPNATKKIENFSGYPVILQLKRTLEGLVQFSAVYSSLGGVRERWNNYINQKYPMKKTSLYITTLTTLTTLNNITTLEEREIDLFNKIDELDINGRNFEIFNPIILVSYLLGEDCLDRTLKIIKERIEEKKEEEFTESKDVVFLEYVSKKVNSLDFIPVNTIVNEFKAFMNDDSEDNWINSRWVGKALKRLGLVVSKKRLAKGVEVVLNIAKAQEKIKMFKKKEKEECLT